MKIVAHRGYSGEYPELSPLAFEKALELPIYGIECDVRTSHDGYLVVNHDATLDRTSNRTGRISKLEWSQIKQADIGTAKYPGQHPLLFEELIELWQYSTKHIYIETKHPSTGGSSVEEQVLVRLHRAGLIDDPRVHIITFSRSGIRRMKRLAPQIDRIFLRRNWERRIAPIDFPWCQPTALGISLMRAQSRPSSIHLRGLATYMWTVDKPEDMRWARKQGVDIMATNQPETALKTVGD